MRHLYLLIAPLTIILALAAACGETKVVPPSPTVVAPSPTVVVVAPSPTVIILEPTPTPTPASRAILTADSAFNAVAAPVPPSRVVLVADITIENTGGTELSYSTSQFRAIDSEGFTHSSEPPVFGTGVPRSYLMPPLFDGILRAGEKVKAQISFDVAAGTQLAQLIWSPPGLPEIAIEAP